MCLIRVVANIAYYMSYALHITSRLEFGLVDDVVYYVRCRRWTALVINGNACCFALIAFTY